MSVNISISANAAGVTQALREVEAALKKAGQEGVALSKIDLSHPELQKLSAEIRTIQARFEDLARVGRDSTAQAVRAMQHNQGVVDPLSWLNALPQTFPNAVQRARHQAAVGGIIFQGTRWQQAGGVAGAAGGGGGGGLGVAGAAAIGGAAGGGGGLPTAGMMLGGMLGPAGMALGLLGGMAVKYAKDMVGPAIAKAADEATANEDLLRHVGGEGAAFGRRGGMGGATGTINGAVLDFENLRDSVRKLGEGLGITIQESQALALAFARVTNDASPDAVMAGVRTGAGLARAYGIAPQTGVAAIGQATQLGIDPNRFALLIAEGVKAGGMSGQIETVMQSLLKWSEDATRTLVRRSRGDEFEAMYAGLNAMDLPGFRGQNAASLIETINASLSHGGNAGIASQAFTYRTLASEGVRGPYETQFLTEGGMFASPAGELLHGSNKSLFQATIEELKAQYAGQKDDYMLLNAMENHLGINMRQGRELLQYKPADLSSTATALKAANIKLENLNPTGIREAVEVATAKDPDLEALRKRMLSRHGAAALTEPEQKELKETAPENLRTMLMKMVGIHGSETTEGTQTRESIKNMSDAMTVQGEKLLKPLNEMRDFGAEIVDDLGGIGSMLADVIRAFGGDKEAAKRLNLGPSAYGIRGGEQSIANSTRESRVKQTVDWFMSEAGGGYTRAQSAALAAQGVGESGMNERAIGPGGIAHGTFQWNATNRAAILKQFVKSVDDMSFEEQLAAMTWFIGPTGPAAAGGARLRKTDNAYEAGKIATTYIEAPDDPDRIIASARGAVSSNIYAKSQPPAPPAPTAAPIHVRIQVRHVDEYGRVLEVEDMPPVEVKPPTPWGPPAKGEPAAVPPPAPPPSRPTWRGDYMQ